MTKVIYNTYSCVISGMSREMMKMDGRDSAEDQNWEKKDIVGINGIVLYELKDKIPNSGCLLQKGAKKETCERRKEEMRCKRFCFYFLERECVFLLSRFLNDPTVGSLWDKKENCSTRRGLRVGTRFREFPQTPRGRGFSLLAFYSLFKNIVNI